jgi:ArsR family transcriptional regulator
VIFYEYLSICSGIQLNVPTYADKLSPTALDSETAERLAEIFASLGDPTRLRILSAMMDHEQNVGALSEAAGISESAASHQLRLLRTLHIVRARKDGRHVYYSLDDEHIRDLISRGVAHVQHG